MNQKQANEIIQCLPKDRSLYPYYKDYYAVQLLKSYTGNGIQISQLKQSHFSKLLNKGPVKKLLANCGGNKLLPRHFDQCFENSSQYFTLTLDLWDGNENGWSQTSRRGWNLVLQLNFSNQHNSQYQKLVKPTEKQALNSRLHPIYSRLDNTYFRETQAWARLDIDLNKDECLIEEIQSDWIRDARRLLADAHRVKKFKRDTFRYWPIEGKPDDVIRYCEYLDQHYGNIWAEAMFSAVLDFINSELGLKYIYYPSSQSGSQVKNIHGSKPPKSLYSNLPKSFCFKETGKEPQMLRDDARYKRLRRKVKDVRWFELEL
jgi:hypothetical protein